MTAHSIQLAVLCLSSHGSCVTIHLRSYFGIRHFLARKRSLLSQLIFVTIISGSRTIKVSTYSVINAETHPMNISLYQYLERTKCGKKIHQNYRGLIQLSLSKIISIKYFQDLQQASVLTKVKPFDEIKHGVFL